MLFLPSFHTSLSLPPPTFLSPQALCDAVWRKLNQSASELLTTDFNFQCLKLTPFKLSFKIGFISPFAPPQLQCVETFITDGSLTGCWHRHCVFGSPDLLWIQTALQCWNHQVWLTGQYIETRGETETLIALLKTDGFPSHFLLLHYSACVLAADLCGIPCNQMKTFPSAMSAVPHFLTSIIPTPTKSHTQMHDFSWGVPPYICWMDCLLHTRGKSEQLKQSHWLIMDTMSWSRKDVHSIYHNFSVWVYDHGCKVCVCTCHCEADRCS